jgi:thiamine pyrophosphate-dependent acetolactate synthase large subunit-like protein
MKPLTKDEVKELKQAVVDNANRYIFTNFQQQDYSKKDLAPGEQVLKNTQDFQKFLIANGIDGKYVKRLSELNFQKTSFLDIKV